MSLSGMVSASDLGAIPDTVYADSSIQAGGGHLGHLEGGAEMAWGLAAELNAALKELRGEIDRLRAYHCRVCGEPAAVDL